MTISLPSTSLKRCSNTSEQRIRQCLLSGAPSNTIAEELGVSVTTVNRLARAQPGFQDLVRKQRTARSLRWYRAAVAQFRSAHPQAPVTEFRNARPEVYMWLYRHDRDWLDAQFEHRKQATGGGAFCDWSRRDAQIAARIRSEAEELLAREGKPRRVSRALLLRRLRVTAVVEKFGSRMPQTQAALASCAQTVSQARIHRLRWAAAQLRHNGSPVAPWRLRRLAGLPGQACPTVERALTQAALGQL